MPFLAEVTADDIERLGSFFTGEVQNLEYFPSS